MVPGDNDGVLLCFSIVLRHFAHWKCCVEEICSTVACCNFIAFCNSVCADRIGMAASGFRASAAACAKWLSFAAEGRKSYCNGCTKVANFVLAAGFYPLWHW